MCVCVFRDNGSGEEQTLFSVKETDRRKRNRLWGIFSIKKKEDTKKMKYLGAIKCVYIKKVYNS